MNRVRVGALTVAVVLAGTTGAIQYDRMETACNNSLELAHPVASFDVQASHNGWVVRHDGGDEIPPASTTNVTLTITYTEGSHSGFRWRELDGGTYPITNGDTALLANTSLSGTLENATVQVVWFGVNTAQPTYCTHWPLFDNRQHLQQPMVTTVEDSSR